MQEIDEKTERLVRLAAAEGVGGILVNSQPNFAWLTGGRSNRIDGSRETGNGSLFVTAQGERYVIANNIEMPRLCDEALAGLAFRPCEYRWTAEHVDPATPIRTARAILGNGCEIGCDGAFAGGRPIEARIASQRAPLTSAEEDRYRTLGRDIGHAVGDVCRTLVPGDDEFAVARRVNGAISGARARPIVTLVAADDRIARFRHPTPSGARWQRRVLVVVCAQRQGLVVALSRLVSAGRPDPAFVARTAASGAVFRRLAAATRPGTTGATLFEVAAQAYTAQGFPGEEQLHHQGGAIGYRSREWVAHPASCEVVQPRQAFAWNPSITGSKVEDTVLVRDEGVENITVSPDWPLLEADADAQMVPVAGVLTL